MEPKPQQNECGCDCQPQSDRSNSARLTPFPMAPPVPKPSKKEEDADIPCCGPPAGPKSSPDERPGYILCHFVERFLSTPAGAVPVVKTALDRKDTIGTVLTRIGIGRNDYKVAPGLYGVGAPDADSPVLVTANYKLSFDALRKELSGINAWILVLDTRGINVWCAAGKRNFSTEEVSDRVRGAGLDRVVNHRKLILPQLSAIGVSARAIKKSCGFEALFGPVRAEDLKRFLQNGMKADDFMRRVTFTLKERVELIPVEIAMLWKPAGWILPAAFFLSGIGPGIFSLSRAWNGMLAIGAGLLMGVLSGGVAAPILLPWLPGRAFAVKGAVTGGIFGLILLGLVPALGWAKGAGLFLFILAISAYQSMNFTGSTPFTSPSGVEKEMRRAIPLLAGAVLISALLWVGSAF